MQQHHNPYEAQDIASHPRRLAETHTYFSLNEWIEGEPEATIGSDGMVNVRPTGTGGPYLSMSVDRWRDLNATVEAAIARAAVTA